MAYNELEKIKKQFCTYTATDKLFEQTSLPSSLWVVFHKMKTTPMTLFQIAEQLSVPPVTIKPTIDELITEKAIETNEECLTYSDWQDTTDTKVVAEEESSLQLDDITIDSPPADETQEDIVAVDIQSEEKESAVISLDID